MNILIKKKKKFIKQVNILLNSIQYSNTKEYFDVYVLHRDLEETEYEIKQIYSVEPNDLTCLMQDESKVEITLITCENGSTTRLIVKAEEKNQDTSYTNSLSNSTTQNIVNEISEENV